MWGRSSYRMRWAEITQGMIAVRNESWRTELAFYPQEARRDQQRTFRITGEWPEVYRNHITNVLPNGRHVCYGTEPSCSDILRTRTWEDRKTELRHECWCLQGWQGYLSLCGFQKTNDVAGEQEQSPEGFQLTVDREPLWDILSLTPKILRD